MAGWAEAGVNGAVADGPWRVASRAGWAEAGADRPGRLASAARQKAYTARQKAKALIRAAIPSCPVCGFRPQCGCKCPRHLRRNPGMPCKGCGVAPMCKCIY